MAYLSFDDISRLAANVKLVPLEPGYRYDSFNCKVEEYNIFLSKKAFDFEELNVSKTHILINKQNADVIGYITLCTDTIKLSEEEKSMHGLEDVEFMAMPALKIGKLAVNEKYEKMGYGTFLLDMARAFLEKVNRNGVACKFITVDVDVEYDPKNIDFYLKNGFIFNEQHKRKNPKTISMRLKAYTDIQYAEQSVGTIN